MTVSGDSLYRTTRVQVGADVSTFAYDKNGCWAGLENNGLLTTIENNDNCDPTSLRFPSGLKTTIQHGDQCGVHGAINGLADNLGEALAI
ncbi:hypothetical protein, partial [Escherichia coli]|uniref:hypothetical protein n=1 Tax=Escherichia coli TaxID=562 RepID=UPI002B2565CD